MHESLCTQHSRFYGDRNDIKVIHFMYMYIRKKKKEGNLAMSKFFP